MAGRDEESQAVMSAAMRYVKRGDRAELERFSLPALKKADLQLGNRDAGSGYRRAIAERIAELQRPEPAQAQQTDVIDVKPNVYGVGLNLNEAWRRFRHWWAGR